MSGNIKFSNIFFLSCNIVFCSGNIQRNLFFCVFDDIFYNFVVLMNMYIYVIILSFFRMLSSLSLISLPLQQKEQESILASEALSNILYDTFYGMGHTSAKLDSNDVLAFCTMHRYVFTLYAGVLKYSYCRSLTYNAVLST